VATLEVIAWKRDRYLRGRSVVEAKVGRLIVIQKHGEVTGAEEV
jgi:hypothetical protein